MWANELSNTFDLLYNNLTSNQAAGLNEYEKSVLLTKAQKELLLNKFDSASNGNTVKKGFDESIIRQADFSTLIRSKSAKQADADIVKIDPRSYVFETPDEVFLILNESLQWQDTDNTVKAQRRLVAISYDEYSRLMSKPYKEPLKWEAWRLITNASNEKPLIEVVATTSDKKKYADYTPWYVVRYVKKPKPIILANFSEVLGEDLSIDGYKGSEDIYTTNDDGIITNPCDMPEMTHEMIVQRAVELAKVAWEGDVNQTQMHITAGQRSE